MPKKSLTLIQSKVLNYIKDTILKKGYPPTVREICDEMGFRSTSSAQLHINSLESKGYIRRDPSKPRTIEVIDDDFNLTRREVVNIPMIGRIAAGQPILAQENINNYFPMPVDMMPNQELFILKVRGDSMINVGIFDGDDIIVAKQPDAKNGEIIAALIDDAATVKRFYQEDGFIRLQPENDNMDPILVKDVKILGRVVGLIRLL